MLTDLVFSKEGEGADSRFVSDAVQVTDDFGLQVSFSTRQNDLRLLYSMDGDNYKEAFKGFFTDTLFSKVVRGVIQGMYIKVSCNNMPSSGKILAVE